MWAQEPGDPVWTLCATGAIVPGCSSTLQDTLTTARLQYAQGTDRELTLDDLDALAALWEWVERTGPRPSQSRWMRGHTP